MTLPPEGVNRLIDAMLAELRRRGPEPLAVGEAQAAKLIGVCPRTLFTLRKAGGIPHTTIGTRVVYPLESLRQWLAARTKAEAGEDRG